LDDISDDISRGRRGPGVMTVDFMRTLGVDETRR